MEIRVGLGQDCHRLEPGRRLVLGGVPIAHEQGLVGHSDADVLLHAVTDALLGAAGLGDIGEMFPNTDPQFLGADSGELLEQARQAVRGEGWLIGNLDCTITAERPRLTPFKQPIRERIAELLTIPADRINIKAKTGEGVGPAGREEAMTAEAIVLLQRD